MQFQSVNILSKFADYHKRICTGPRKKHVMSVEAIIGFFLKTGKSVKQQWRPEVTRKESRDVYFTF